MEDEEPTRKRGRPSKLQEDQKVIRGNSIKKVSKKVVKEVNLSEIGIEMLNNVERMSSKGNLKEHKKVEKKAIQKKVVYLFVHLALNTYIHL